MQPKPRTLIDPVQQALADEALHLACLASRSLDGDPCAVTVVVAHRSSSLHAIVLKHGGRDAGDFAIQVLAERSWMVADVPPDAVACLLSLAGGHTPIGLAVVGRRGAMS